MTDRRTIQRRNGSWLLGLGVVALLAVGCRSTTEPGSDPVVADASTGVTQPEEVVPYAEQTPEERNAIARMEGYFPDTELFTHTGETVRFYSDLVRDKKVVINFMYTECGGI